MGTSWNQGKAMLQARQWMASDHFAGTLAFGMAHTYGRVIAYRFLP